MQPAVSCWRALLDLQAGRDADRLTLSAGPPLLWLCAGVHALLARYEREPVLTQVTAIGDVNDEATVSYSHATPDLNFESLLSAVSGQQDDGDGSMLTPSGVAVAVGVIAGRPPEAHDAACQIWLECQSGEAGLRFRVWLPHGDGDADAAAGHLKRLIRSGLASPHTPVWQLDMLSASEQAAMCAALRWNDDSTAERLYPTRPVTASFTAACDAQPESEALWSLTDGSLTYTELRSKVEIAAHGLHTLGQVRAGDRVGLGVAEGVPMVILMLAIACVGAVVVPLDVSAATPRARLDFILGDVRAKVLLVCEPLAQQQGSEGAGPQCITYAEVCAAGAGATKAELVSAIDVDVSLDSESHIVYTSGTTGRPKGVVCTHRNLAAYALAKNETHDIAAGSRVLLASAITFDPCLGDVFATLIAGGVLCVAPRASVLHELDLVLEKSRASHVLSTPALWSVVRSSPADLPHLRVLALGGEAMPGHLVQQWGSGAGVRLCNTYGVTEATVYQSLATVKAGADPRYIGAPFPNVEFGIRNSFGSAMPPGRDGELWIGGVQVAGGYLNAPEQTSRAFVEEPGGKRWYRTGDIACLGEGGVYVKGRADFQVKLRGMRVELEEVEGVTAQCKAVARAVASVRDGRLLVYVVPNAGVRESSADSGAATTSKALETEEERMGRVYEGIIQLHCGRWLPRHMVPSAVVVLDRLPLTVNHKVDRGALPDPPERKAHAEELTPMESLVATAWGQVLGLPASSISKNDDFFSLGGDSLAALRGVRAVRLAIAGEGTKFRDPENDVGHILGTFAVREFLSRPVLAQYAAYLVAQGERAPDDDMPRDAAVPNGENGAAHAGGGGTGEPVDGAAEDVAVGVEGLGLEDEVEDAEGAGGRAVPAGGADRSAELLAEAVRLGRPRLVQALLDCGVSPEAGWCKQHRLPTALHIAAALGHIQCAEALLSAGARLNAVDRASRTPVFGAAEHSTAALELLIRHGAAGTAKDKNKQTLLHTAARAGNAAAVRLIPTLVPTLDKDLLDRWGRSALHWAVVNGHTEAVRACIEVGVCVNTRMPERVQSKRTSLRTETALEIAARTGRDDIYQLLVGAGAGSTVREPQRRAPTAVLAERREATSFPQDPLTTEETDHESHGEGV